MNDPLVVERRLFGRIEWFLLLAAVLLAGVLAPLAHALLPEGAALRPSSYLVTLAGKFACYAILAVAMDLIWGYAGILSLGQSLWFALGGYVFGMHLMR
ncbi:MAG: urea ABC transporter permease subunit UrtC, partial [Betaproteobacteria bacterium]|nr:urea ABC transporter permease subunit UrtC [Betaproteobacteria bacterium]